MFQGMCSTGWLTAALNFIQVPILRSGTLALSMLAPWRSQYCPCCIADGQAPLLLLMPLLNITMSHSTCR